jgi:SP family general alpha glucoside:H+ symporter-like MFS transporter
VSCYPSYHFQSPISHLPSSLLDTLLTLLPHFSLLIWNFTFDWSVGPVAYAIFCEVSATRVRSKTIAVATAVQALVGIVMTVAIPYLINPDQANLRGKLGFFFGGLSIPCLLWCWLR